MCRVMQSELSSLLENRRIHKLMTEGVYVQHYVNNCTVTAGKTALINVEQPEQNDLLAVSQFVVICSQNNRQPDVAVFINGLLLAMFNQLQTYKNQIPGLFKTDEIRDNAH